MADALQKYRPEWIVVRTRFLRNPRIQFTGKGGPFRSDEEVHATLDHSEHGYWIMAMATLNGTQVRYQSCDMAILERKDLVQVPPGYKLPEMRVQG